jgi:hypothetical protein
VDLPLAPAPKWDDGGRPAPEADGTDGEADVSDDEADALDDGGWPGPEADAPDDSGAAAPPSGEGLKNGSHGAGVNRRPVSVYLSSAERPGAAGGGGKNGHDASRQGSSVGPGASESPRGPLPLRA